MVSDTVKPYPGSEGVNDLPAIEEATGDKLWYKNGLLHRENLPAVIRSGHKQWYRNGKMHRVGLPALEDSSGYKEWWMDGEKHHSVHPVGYYHPYGAKIWWSKNRVHRNGDLPAMVYGNGTKYWYKNGKLHRETLPAIEWANGGKAWYKNGKLHRDTVVNGNYLPAMEWANGVLKWFIDGIEIQGIPGCDKIRRAGDICPITLEEIQPGSFVSKCDGCQKVFMSASMDDWLKKSKTCPHCRRKWTNYRKYIVY